MNSIYDSDYSLDLTGLVSMPALGLADALPSSVAAGVAGSAIPAAPAPSAAFDPALASLVRPVDEKQWLSLFDADPNSFQELGQIEDQDTPPTTAPSSRPMSPVPSSVRPMFRAPAPAAPAVPDPLSALQGGMDSVFGGFALPPPVSATPVLPVTVAATSTSSVDALSVAAATPSSLHVSSLPAVLPSVSSPTSSTEVSPAPSRPRTGGAGRRAADSACSSAPAASRLERRRASNRAAAIKYRNRKLAEMAELETRCAELRAVNTVLQTDNDTLRSANEQLTEKLHKALARVAMLEARS